MVLLVPIVAGCNQPLGMENGQIKDEQITFSAFASHQFNTTKGRLNGRRWCGSYKKYYGKVSVKLRFPSVMQIRSILFQREKKSNAQHAIKKVYFLYYNAEDRRNVVKETKVSECHFFLIF